MDSRDYAFLILGAALAIWAVVLVEQRRRDRAILAGTVRTANQALDVALCARGVALKVRDDLTGDKEPGEVPAPTPA